jgi:hypothetical protein
LLEFSWGQIFGKVALTKGNMHGRRRVALITAIINYNLEGKGRAGVGKEQTDPLRLLI